MRKYNTENCLASMSKMEKTFPELIKNKKETTNNKKYLYDFSLINGKIPEDIMETIYNQAMQQTDVINCLAICNGISKDMGKKYYVYMDFIPYKICNMDTGKTRYSIMELSAIKISVHDMNIYGYAENIPSDYIEIGHWKENTLTYINDIEI